MLDMMIKAAVEFIIFITILTFISSRAAVGAFMFCQTNVTFKLLTTNIATILGFSVVYLDMRIQ